MFSDKGAMSNDPSTAYDNYFIPQGVACDLLATIAGYSRDDIDSYAIRSQQRAARAWEEGRFDRSVVPVTDINGETVLDRDEHMRPGATKEALAGLPSAFAAIGDFGGFNATGIQKYPFVEKVDHVHTGGNSSGIVDGAALVVVGSAAAGEASGLTPRARIVSTATSGADPVLMFEGPLPAVDKALAKAGLTVADIDVFEMNEAFGAVALHVQKHFDVPDEKYNVNGGAIAMGHPLGATGAMLLGTVLDELERTGGRYGLITLCVAGGMGVATIIERVSA